MEKRRRLEEVWEKAGESIGCEEVPGVNHEAKIMVEGLEQIRAMIKETEDKIKELCEQFPEYHYILTIPGFGPDVSAKVLGAIGDADRFQNGKQVLKMGGLDLSADRSGKDSDKAIPEISKRGKADLRYALYQAALVASLQNRDVMIYYTNKIRGREREKGIQIKMRVKLAAKLLVIAWTLMKKKVEDGCRVYTIHLMPSLDYRFSWTILRHLLIDLQTFGYSGLLPKAKSVPKTSRSPAMKAH
jgi:transposase